MSAIPSSELLRLWKIEKLPIEQAIGHILQNLANIQKSVDVVNTAYFSLCADVDNLSIQIDTNLNLESIKEELSIM